MFGLFQSLFANPALAAGAAAGAIPIVIHLLNRRKYRRIWWAAMHWLWASQKKAMRRLRVEQLILLLLRILALVLLALALARPLLNESQGLFAGRPSVCRVIVLDDSYSMGRLSSGRTLFDRAKALAGDLAEELGAGDELEIIAADDVRAVSLASETLRRDDILRELRAAKLSDAGTNLPKALAAACRVLNKRQTKQVRREIVLLSDETRLGWETPGGEPRQVDAADSKEITAAFKDPLRRPTIAVVRFTADKENVENAAAVSLALTERVAPTEVELELTAVVRNFGRRKLEKLPVVLTLFAAGGEKRNLGQREVDVPPGGKQAAVSFTHLFREPGSYAFRVHIPEDVLPADNDAFLAVDVEKHVKVLCVDGQRRLGAMDDETDFLRQALAPDERAAEEAGAGRMPLLPVIVGDAAFAEQNLDNYRLVVLANVRTIPAEKISALVRWVKNGGALWIWLGDRIDPALYNRELNALLPAMIGEPVGEGDPNGPAEYLDEKELSHPALAAFRGEKGSMSLGRLALYRRFRLLPLLGKKEAGTTRVVLRVRKEGEEPEQPFAVERRVGEGRVLLMGSTADTDWNNWGRRVVYMRLINALALYLIRPTTADRNRPVGEPFIYRLPRDELGAARRGGVRLLDPDGEMLSAKVETETARVVGAPTVRAGAYRLLLPGSPPKLRWCAAIRRTAESDLTSCSKDEVLAGFRPEKDRPAARGPYCDAPVLQSDVLVLPGETKTVEEALHERSRGREIWRALVWLVLFILLAESLLARRMDNFNR